MHDRLLLIPASLAAFVALAEFLLGRRRSVWIGLAVQAACLAVLSVALSRLGGSPFLPEPSGPAVERVSRQLLELAWWAMVAWLAVIAARLVLARRTGPRESRILSDLFAGLVTISAALAVTAFVFGIPVRGLLATSGIIAIVLGLALQSTLSDLFSGIAVGVERPYRTGDMLSVDGGVGGRVVQVNWRSTHIQIGHDVAIVPNSVVAKSRLVNQSAPTPTSGESLEVRVHPDVPPGQVLPVLQAALESCESLAPSALAIPLCSGVSGDGTTYTLKFASSTADAAASVRSEVLSQVHRHLFHAGIPLAIAGAPPTAQWSVRTLSAEDLLARSDLFAGVAVRNRILLARRLAPVELQAGETLFRFGAPPDAMFMIGAGTIEILAGDPATARRRFLVAPGESVGLVGLVTGEPYRTTATALNPVRAFRLDGPGLAQALADAPDLADELEDAVGRALAVMARFDVDEEKRETPQRVALLSRLRIFLCTIR